MSGIDTLYATYDVCTRGGQLDFAALDEAKARLRDDPNRTVHAVKLAGLDLGLTCTGSFPYRFRLDHPDMTLKLSGGISPALLVEFRSHALWTQGPAALHARILAWCEAMGFRSLAGDTVSRVDVAFDYHLAEPDFTEDHVVSRLAKDGISRTRQRRETIRYGTGSVVLRFYDKAREVAQASGKTWFFDLWGRTDEVWRVEFQLKRDALKDRGVGSLSSLGERLPIILHTLATEHTRLAVPTTDTNRSRWPTHPLWVDFQEQACALPPLVFAGGRQIPADGLPVLHERSKQAVLGYCKRIGAELTLLREGSDQLEAPASLDDILACLRAHANDDLPPGAWKEDVVAKAEALAVRGRA